MAVRVVGQPEGIKQVRCSGCNHVLEYQMSDVRYFRHDIDQEVGYIVCPRLDCQKHTTVPGIGAEG